MGWVLTTSLAALRRDLNATFPSRDKASDGTIGDAAHQLETSGHNPDDTAGSKSEYIDADTKQEVRAFDADNDLRDPRGIDFQQVIDAILRTPADRDRLMYIIHRRKIWRKRTGWKQETYTGSSPHNEHGHFSGDPNQDENGAPWTSVLSFKASTAGGTMASVLTTAEQSHLSNADEYGYQGNRSVDPIVVKGSQGENVAVPNLLAQTKALVQQLVDRPAVAITPTPEQWQQFLDLVETTLAAKSGAAAREAVRELLVGAGAASLRSLNGGTLPA